MTSEMKSYFPPGYFDEQKEEPKKTEELKTPLSIYNELNDYVIGQDKAKKILSVAAYNHYKRMNYNKENPINPEIELQKSNVLIMGDTGCGKTLLVRSLAKILDLPLYIADATKFTEAGYVGDNVEDCIKSLYKIANEDVEKANYGIIFLDECDKLAASRGMTGKDVGGESVQQALLALIEGTTINLGYKANVSTKNILFIFGGAFSGIDKIVEKRVNKNSKCLGFGASLQTKSGLTKSELISKVTPKDLTDYGMIPELIGRLPIKAKLHSLDEEMLVRILTEPKDSIIDQYVMIFELDGIYLCFNYDALKLVARIALQQETGARGLRTIIEDVMLPIMFLMPLKLEEKALIITKKIVEDSLAEI